MMVFTAIAGVAHTCKIRLDQFPAGDYQLKTSSKMKKHSLFKKELRKLI